MSAAAFANVFDPSQYSIKLIESSAISSVGVGEATIPPIRQFNRMLGIDEDEFIRNTNGTFKLGIEFVNWGKIGDAYMHPFGAYGTKFGSLTFYNYWLKYYLQGKSQSISDYSLSVQAAKSKKFMRPAKLPNSPLAEITYAFHFDAGLYAQFLRNFAESRGVQRIDDIVDQVNIDPINGQIRSLDMKSGEHHKGDLFIDCTGFKALLIQGALKTGFEDWSNYLLCDSAVTVATKNTETPAPYTRATAHPVGWQWRIPLQSRVGNGYVYSQSFISDDDAKQVLLDNIQGETINDPRVIRFKTGIRKKVWHKNCISIGLSSGFLEPLESTSIHLIQTALAKLLAFFPTQSFDEELIDQYNALMREEFENVRDFVILHYKLTEREDSDFWRYCKNMDIPVKLQHKMAMFKSTGRLHRENNELFDVISQFAVMFGQGLIPESYHPLADDVNDLEFDKGMNAIKEVITRSAEAMPTQEEFIKKHCEFKPSP
ncbi:Flavin-dependent tryptophan halogenase RebH [Thalassocella blandensis]|nr:Flavin-dependent tryptophan halogenase RebH [Thalassocella blandensis]